MKVQSNPIALLAAPKQASKPQASPDQVAPVADKVETSQTTPLYLKAGKVGLALAATAGLGSLGYFAGTGAGTAQLVAGIATGAVAGGVGLGVLGLVADVMSLGGNRTGKALAAGAVIGAGLGALASSHPVGGAILAAGGGLAAFAVVAASTNILRK